MASVLHDGGSDPIIPKTWEDDVLVAILYDLDNGPKPRSEATGPSNRYINNGYSGKAFEHQATQPEVEKIFDQMAAEGLIEERDMGDWGKRFKLTDKGRDRMPEHIFP